MQSASQVADATLCAKVMTHCGMSTRPVPVSDAIDVNLLKEKVRAAGCKLKAPANVASILELERKHELELPAEYRAFLLEVGNGGAGPPAYGLYDIDTAFAERRKGIYTLADPFEPPLSGHDYVDLTAPGMLLLGTHGCAYYDGLVVSGPERGQVWTFIEEHPGWIPIRDESRVPPEHGDHEDAYDVLLSCENRQLRVCFSRYFEQWLDWQLSRSSNQ